MNEQILNEEKTARRIIANSTSKALVDLVRSILQKLGRSDLRVEEILFTPEGRKAKKELIEDLADLLQLKVTIEEKESSLDE